MIIMVAFIIFYYSRENNIFSSSDGKQSRWANRIDTLPHHTYHTHTHASASQSSEKKPQPEHERIFFSTIYCEIDGSAMIEQCILSLSKAEEQQHHKREKKRIEECVSHEFRTHIWTFKRIVIPFMLRRCVCVSSMWLHLHETYITNENPGRCCCCCCHKHVTWVVEQCEDQLLRWMFPHFWDIYFIHSQATGYFVVTMIYSLENGEPKMYVYRLKLW